MKISVQLGLIPGSSIADKQRWAADHGVDGIEIYAGTYAPDQLAAAVDEWAASPVPCSSICGNPSFDFLDPDPGKRRNSLDQCKGLLKLAGALGAVGQIVPPIFGGPRINDLSPFADAITLEKQLLVPLVQQLGDVAVEAGTLLMLEPLNRYEQHLLRTLDNGVEICEKANHPGVVIMADFFHMHIEETSTPDALRRAARWVKHCHLADNTRNEPGTGDIDFVAAFRVLKEVGFDGFMAYECGLAGADREAALIKSLAYVRECLEKA